MTFWPSALASGKSVAVLALRKIPSPGFDQIKSGRRDVETGEPAISQMGFFELINCPGYNQHDWTFVG